MAAQNINDLATVPDEDEFYRGGKLEEREIQREKRKRIQSAKERHEYPKPAWLPGSRPNNHASQPDSTPNYDC